MATATEKRLGKQGITDVAAFDKLKKLGWRVENLESGFSAYEINGDRKIGPVATLSALEEQIDLMSGPPKEKKPAGKSADGEQPRPAAAVEQRLPSMEEPEIDELNRLCDIAIEAKEAKDKAVATFKDECDVTREKMREYGRKRYTRRGFVLTIEDSEKLVIKKAEQAPPKNPSTKPGR